MQCSIRERRDVSTLRARENRRYDHRVYGANRDPQRDTIINKKRRSSRKFKEQTRQDLVQKQIEEFLL